MPRKKDEIKTEREETLEETPSVPATEEVGEVKKELLELYSLMKKYAVNSIGDVEVKLSRLQ